MGWRERWFQWVVGRGDITVQRSNKQRNDQDERESKAVTMGFMFFQAHDQIQPSLQTPGIDRIEDMEGTEV